MEAPPQSNMEQKFPEEILDVIIRSVSVEDLLNVMLSSQTLYRLAKPHFYRSIYYFGGGIDRCRSDFYLEGNTRMGCVPSHPKFTLSPDTFLQYEPSNSARVIRLAEFLRTITENSELLSYINDISLSTGSMEQRGATRGTEAEKERFEILTSITSNLALTNTVTSMDIMYPGVYLQAGVERNHLLRDRIYSIFSIRSLLNLCLRSARSWSDFSPCLDQTKVGTSNVISISLLDTVPMDSDLQEILTWPKGLKYFHQDNQVDDDNHFFQITGSEGTCASPNRFLHGITSQRHTLEELSCNYVEDWGGGDDTPFIPAHISQFIKLTHMSVGRECLVWDGGGPHPLYTTLPPNIQQLHINETAYSSREESEVVEYVTRMRDWLQEVADHRKGGLPALNTIVSWLCDYAYRANEYRLEAQTVLKQFEEDDIPMEFVFWS